MSREEKRAEIKTQLEADEKLKELMDRSGSNNPPPPARIPDTGCAAGQGLRPDRSGFGRWTCQVLPTFKAPTKDEDHDPSARELAEARLREAKKFIELANSVKEGPQLLADLAAAEAAFRNAATNFLRAGDDESMFVAIQEASRIALIRFVERYENKAPPAQACNKVSDEFDRIDRDNSQSVNLMARVKHICVQT
jgi:hypothetical protein